MNPLKTPNWFGQSTKESPNFLEELIVSLLRKPTSLSQVAWWNPTPPPFTWEDKPFSFSNQTNLSSVSCRLSEDHHHFHSLSQFGQPWWHLSVGLLKRSCVQQSIFKSIWRVPKREGFHSPQQNRRQNPQTQELNWKEYGKPHNNHGQNITFIWKKNIAPFPKKPSVSLSFSFSVRSSSWEAEPIIGYKSEITSGMRMFNKVKKWGHGYAMVGRDC